jgi:hypothetical protein
MQLAHTILIVAMVNASIALPVVMVGTAILLAINDHRAKADAAVF